MRNNPLLFLMILATVFTACSRQYSRMYEEPRTITQSLFDFKDRTISEADIQRILDGKIVPPDTLRVAVYKFSGSVSRRFGTRSGYGWADEDRIKTDQQIADTLISAIRQSKRVQKVLSMPVLVTGYQPNIHQLREAAVRLQADMLLIYTLNSDFYQQYRSLKKDDAKAYATCEAVLMDIRTGIIPHAGVVTREAYSKRGSGDLSAEEFRRRVQNTAVLNAIAETGNQVAVYLK